MTQYSLLADLYRQGKLRKADRTFPDGEFGHEPDYALWRLLRATGDREEERPLFATSGSRRELLFAALRQVAAGDSAESQLSACVLVCNWLVQAMIRLPDYWYVGHPTELIIRFPDYRAKHIADRITRGYFRTMCDHVLRLQLQVRRNGVGGDATHRREAEFLGALTDIVRCTARLHVMTRTEDFFDRRRSLDINEVTSTREETLKALQRARSQFDTGYFLYTLKDFSRKGFGSASDFLPFNLEDYNTMVAILCATLAKESKRLTGILGHGSEEGARWQDIRFEGCARAVAHREIYLLRGLRRETRRERANAPPLITIHGVDRHAEAVRRGLDELRYIEQEAGAYPAAAALAAHWLQIIDVTSGITKQILRQVSENKKIALEFGFRVPDSILEIDTSAAAKGRGESATPIADVVNIRYGRKGWQSQRTTVGKYTSSATRKIRDCRDGLERLLDRGPPYHVTWQYEYVLKQLRKLLGFAAEESVEPRILELVSEFHEWLLSRACEVFDALIANQRASTVMSLLQFLMRSDKLGGLLTAHRLQALSSLLLNTMERTYLMNVEARAQWQRTFAEAIALVPEAELEALPLEIVLDVQAVISHVGTTAIRGVFGEKRQEYISRAIFGDFGSTHQSAGEPYHHWHAWATSDVRAEPEQVLRVLQRSDRDVGRTVFAYACLLNRRTVQTLVLGVRRVNGEDQLVHEVRRFIFGGARPDDEFGHLEDWDQLTAHYRSADESPFTSSTGALKSLATLSVGCPAVRILVRGMHESADRLCESDGGSAEHIVLSPGPELAVLPWQYLFDQLRIDIGVSLVPSIAWCLATVRKHPLYRPMQGLRGWLASEPTPTNTIDARGIVSGIFHGAGPGNPALLDMKSLSLNFVFGHGRPSADKPGFVDSSAVPEDDWQVVREARIVLLLSCHTGLGTDAGLRDYVGLPSYLLVRSMAVIAPPKMIPYTAAVELANQFRNAIDEALMGKVETAFATYRKATRCDPRTAIFTYWGLPWEAIVWTPYALRQASSTTTSAPDTALDSAA